MKEFSDCEFTLTISFCRHTFTVSSSGVAAIDQRNVQLSASVSQDSVLAVTISPSQQRLSVRIDQTQDDFSYAQNSPPFVDSNREIWERVARPELSQRENAVLELGLRVSQWGSPHARLEFEYGTN